MSSRKETSAQTRHGIAAENAVLDDDEINFARLRVDEIALDHAESRQLRSCLERLRNVQIHFVAIEVGVEGLAAREIESNRFGVANDDLERHHRSLV